MNSKFKLLTAFGLGTPFVATTASGLLVSFAVINRVEREDGSNRGYNVTGLVAGKTETVFIRTQD